MVTYRKDSKHLNVEINSAVKDALKEQTRTRCQLLNDVTNAAMRLWLALPVGMQAEIMADPTDNILDYLRSRISPSSGDTPHVQTG